MTDNLLVGGVIACAGISKRMGAFKPLLPVGSVTMIESAVQSILYTEAKEIIVILGYRKEEIEHILIERKHYPVKIVYNSNFLESGMGESVKIALRNINLDNLDAVFILPGDMPKIKPSTYETLKSSMYKNNSLVVIPTINSELKYPVLVNKLCFNKIINSPKDNLMSLLEEFKDKTILKEVNDFGCTLDTDTPKQYSKLLEYSLEIGSRKNLFYYKKKVN